MRENLVFGRNLPKISILVKFCENLILVEMCDNLDFGRHFAKISILVEILQQISVLDEIF